jgi:hypothetical protein
MRINQRRLYPGVDHEGASGLLLALAAMTAVDDSERDQK